MLEDTKENQVPLVIKEREETEVSQAFQDPSALLDQRDLVERMVSRVSMENLDQKEKQVLREDVDSQELQVPMDKTELQDFLVMRERLVFPEEMVDLEDLAVVEEP